MQIKKIDKMADMNDYEKEGAIQLSTLSAILMCGNASLSVKTVSNFKLCIDQMSATMWSILPAILTHDDEEESRKVLPLLESQIDDVVKKFNRMCDELKEMVRKNRNEH